MKAVFDTKPTSIYDDDVTRHYQFPSQYLPVVEACIGDWIVFRRPKRDGGDMAYFATARVKAIRNDEVSKRLHFALLDGYWQFEHIVPWTAAGRYWEEALRTDRSQGVGAYLQGRSTRFIGEADFSDIIAAGFSDTLSPLNAERTELPLETILTAEAQLAPPVTEGVPRRTESVLTNRLIREASFRKLVREAYDNRCAITRLHMLDGRGNPEAQAAHIWAVSDGGPDVIQNGIALTATAHWLFDRHLISITNEYRLLLAGSRIPPELRALLTAEGTAIHLPSDASKWPHPSYLGKHRALFLAKNADHEAQAITVNMER